MQSINQSMTAAGYTRRDDISEVICLKVSHVNCINAVCSVCTCVCVDIIIRLPRIVTSPQDMACLVSQINSVMLVWTLGNNLSVKKFCKHIHMYVPRKECWKRQRRIDR